MTAPDTDSTTAELQRLHADLAALRRQFSETVSFLWQALLHSERRELRARLAWQSARRGRRETRARNTTLQERAAEAMRRLDVVESLVEQWERTMADHGHTYDQLTTHPAETEEQADRDLAAAIEERAKASTYANVVDQLRAALLGRTPVVEVDLADVDDVPQCRMCGCTDNAACDGGCQWVPDPMLMGELCSRCAESPHVAALQPGRRLQLLHEVLAEVVQRAGDPPADMLTVPDGTGDPASAINLAAHQDHLADTLAGGADAPPMQWSTLLMTASWRVVAASSDRVLRRELIGLAAIAAWWAEVIEVRSYKHLPDGASPSPRP